MTNESVIAGVPERDPSEDITGNLGTGEAKTETEDRIETEVEQWIEIERKEYQESLDAEPFDRPLELVDETGKNVRILDRL